jgi:hypothetical protein
MSSLTSSFLSIVADTLKGSFYANPIQVDHTASPEEMHAFPEYYGKNIC